MCGCKATFLHTTTPTRRDAEQRSYRAVVAVRLGVLRFVVGVLLPAAAAEPAAAVGARPVAGLRRAERHGLLRVRAVHHAALCAAVRRRRVRRRARRPAPGARQRRRLRRARRRLVLRRRRAVPALPARHPAGAGRRRRALLRCVGDFGLRCGAVVGGASVVAGVSGRVWGDQSGVLVLQVCAASVV